MTFTQQQIHDLAAEMFWRYAEAVGVRAANINVIETQGHCLAQHDFDRSVFETCGLLGLPSEERQRIIAAVKDEALTHCLEERNIIGTIYADEAEIGRTPSCATLDTSHIGDIPVIRESPPVPTMGTLCLRHPLPAIVYSPRMPETMFIRVASTQQALGFELPLYLQLTGLQELPDHSYALIGIFYIPVPSTKHGNLWSHVIQNSMRLVDTIEAHTDTGVFKVSINWPNAKPGLLSRILQR